MDSRNVPGEATDDWLTLSSSTGRTVPVSVTMRLLARIAIVFVP